MNTTAKSMEEILVETGFAAKMEAKAEERNTLKIAKKMISSGFPLETVVSITELDPERVKELYQG